MLKDTDLVPFCESLRSAASSAKLQLHGCASGRHPAQACLGAQQALAPSAPKEEDIKHPAECMRNKCAFSGAKQLVGIYLGCMYVCMYVCRAMYKPIETTLQCVALLLLTVIQVLTCNQRMTHLRLKFGGMRSASRTCCQSDFMF